MRILLVGATGTIGRAIVAALSADNEIIRQPQSTPLRWTLQTPPASRRCTARPASWMPLCVPRGWRNLLRSPN